MSYIKKEGFEGNVGCQCTSDLMINDTTKFAKFEDIDMIIPTNDSNIREILHCYDDSVQDIPPFIIVMSFFSAKNSLAILYQDPDRHGIKIGGTYPTASISNLRK